MDGPVAGATGTTRVTVYGRDRRAARGASLYAVNALGDYRSLGATDEHGALSAALTAEDHLLVVRHSESALHRSAIASPVPSLIEVQLVAGGAVSGVVVRDGRAAAGALVVAWPSQGPEQRFTTRQALQSARGAPDALHVRAGARGEFELHGLARDRDYTVLAAATGALCSNAPESVRAPATNVVLELAPVFGARVALGTAGAGCASAPAETPLADVLEVLDPNAVRLPLDVGPLLGLSAVDSANYSSSQPTFLFRSLDPSAQRVGPLRMGIRRVGFEPRTFEFQCEPVADAVPLVQLDLQPVRSCFGAVEIGPCASALGHVVLDRGEERARLELVGREETARLCLPCGLYSAAWGPFSRSPDWPLADVEVSAGAVSVVALPLDRLGGVSFRIERDGSGSFGGHVPLDIALVEDRHGRPRTQRHLDLWAPDERDEYRILGLPEGRYVVALNGPFIPEGELSFDSEGWIGPIEVAAGALTHFRLRYVE